VITKRKKGKTGDNRAVTFRNMNNEGSEQAAKADSYVSKIAVEVQ
jgi:hypothetical protein